MLYKDTALESYVPAKGVKESVVQEKNCTGKCTGNAAWENVVQDSVVQKILDREIANRKCCTGNCCTKECGPNILYRKCYICNTVLKNVVQEKVVQTNIVQYFLYDILSTIFRAQPFLVQYSLCNIFL